MAIPALASVLFGIKGFKAGKSLFNQGKTLKKKLHPKTAKISTGLPKKTEIKTAKPATIKPAKPSKPTAEEKAQVMSWYKDGSALPKTSSLQPKRNATKVTKPKTITKKGVEMSRSSFLQKGKKAPKAPINVINPDSIKKGLEKDYAMGELFGTRS